jgi:hypothetical protein
VTIAGSLVKASRSRRSAARLRAGAGDHQLAAHRGGARAPNADGPADNLTVRCVIDFARPLRILFRKGEDRTRMKKIDVFNHIWPKPFFDALIDHIGTMTDITKRSGAVPMMTDLDRRFEVMDMFGEDYCQILSLASPPLEKFADPDKALELSRIGSDSMAELCQKYPDRFPAFIGTAPMNNPDAWSRIARAIEDLGAGGMQIFTNVRASRSTCPNSTLLRLHERGRQAGLAAPGARPEFPRLPDRGKSEYEIWWTFGWPYETSAAMARMVFSGSSTAIRTSRSSPTTQAA